MISGKAKLAGVIGWPIAHSLSPILHNGWIEELGLDAAYVPLAIAPESFESLLRTLPMLGFMGVNVTLPHKETAFRLCDFVDDHARHLGAVNTIVFDRQGKIHGSNTDAFGFIENLKQEAGPDLSMYLDCVVMIGAGGAARAVLSSLIEHHARRIIIINRTRHKAEALRTHFGGPVEVMDWQDKVQALSEASLLVNSTSLGMEGQPPLDLTLNALHPTALVTDIVYKPLETPLLTLARAKGNPVVDGLGMLIHQARPGFAQWFGREPRVTAQTRQRLLAHITAGK